MDPRTGPVSLRVSGTSAELLVRLGEALGTDDGGVVMMRALGLLDLALKARREGKRLVFYDPARESMSDVVF